MLLLIVVFSMVNLVQKFRNGGMLVIDVMMYSIRLVIYGLCVFRFLKLLMFLVLKLLWDSVMIVLKLVVDMIVQFRVQNSVVVQFFLLLSVMLSSRKLMCDMVEYVSMCLRLVWVIVIRLLIISDSVVRLLIRYFYLLDSGFMFIFSRWQVMLNVVSFGVELMNSVIGVGVFWYMLGSYMWNGVVFSLNVMLVIMKIVLVSSSIFFFECGIVVWIMFRCSELVVLQISDMLYSSRLEVSEFSMMYFIVVLEVRLFLWLLVISVQEYSVSSFRFRQIISRLLVEIRIIMLVVLNRISIGILFWKSLCLCRQFQLQIRVRLLQSMIMVFIMLVVVLWINMLWNILFCLFMLVVSMNSIMFSVVIENRWVQILFFLLMNRFRINKVKVLLISISLGVSGGRLVVVSGNSGEVVIIKFWN